MVRIITSASNQSCHYNILKDKTTMEDKIKPQDLRIGNMLLTPSGEIFKVRDISHDYIAFQACKSGGLVKHYIEDLKPVKLSEDWLLKLGFKRGGYDQVEVWHPDNPRFVMVGYLDTEEEVNDGLGWNYERDKEEIDGKDWKHSRMDIKYVHQLQNLYYALTGSELTINDNTKQ